MAERTRLDLMIDLECLGPAPNGAIVSIGWCAFALDGLVNSTGEALGPASDSAYGRIAVDVQSCLDIGMEIDADTVGWWLRQDPPVRALYNEEGRVSIQEALARVNRLYLDHCTLSKEPGYLWAYPATYDLSILDRAFVLAKVKREFGRKEYLCSRSAMKALGYRRADENVPEKWRTKHLPELDSVRQVIQMQLAFNPQLRKVAT